MSDRSAVEAAVVDAHRREWAFVVAATVRVVARISTWREECVQEAYAAALEQLDRRTASPPTRPPG